MPAAPRPEGKAKKIAYKVLGTPANSKQKPTPLQKKINDRLVFEETTRVR